MLLNGGTLDGRRYLSEAAVKQMTTKQTGDAVEKNYGFGLDTGGGNYGHGGAHSTSMNMIPARGLALVWMVQHAGFPGEGGRSQEVFRKTADALFGRNAER